MYFQIKIIIFILSATLIEIEIIKAQNLTLKNHTSVIRGIKFTKDNKVITTSQDAINKMKVWDPLKNWTLVADYFQDIPSGCCVFSSNEVNKNGLFAAATDKIAYVWNLTDSNKLIQTFNQIPYTIYSFGLTSNNILATGFPYPIKTINLWQMSSNNSLLTLAGHTFTVTSLAFLSDY
jgi:WD40 repeat protein